uniref:Uncharacterized protein n=1 Tax=Octopus bimaculoides TaxID=37653 RepID=A0A0L8HF61_OCTBM
MWSYSFYTKLVDSFALLLSDWHHLIHLLQLYWHFHPLSWFIQGVYINYFLSINNRYLFTKVSTF